MPLELIRAAVALIMIEAVGVSVLCWMHPPAWCPRIRDRIALGHLVGASVLTWIEMVSASVSGRISLLPVYAAVLCVALVARKRFAGYLFRPGRVISIESSTARAWSVIPAALLVLAMASALSGLIWTSPLISDAYVNYALKAKAFFATGTLRSLAQNCCLHNGYPLLVPIQSWWLFTHIGRVSVRWVQALGLPFYLDGVILAYAIFSSQVSRTWALAGAAMIAAEPVSSLTATSGLADPVLATYFFASALFLEDYRTRRDRSSWVILLLLLAGAIQTKNEGIPWAAFALVALFFIERGSRWKTTALSVASLVVAVLPWTWIKYHDRIPVPYYHMSVASLGAVRGDLARRVAQIVRVYFFQPFVPFVWIYLFVVIPFSFWFTRGRKMPPSPLMLGMCGAQLATYLFLTLTASNFGDIMTFFERAISHLTPVVVAACLFACFRPESAELAPSEQ